MNAQPRQRIVRERRQYNQWVASQTLEDFALRYTPERARKSAFRVGNTALGPIAFLACEAIGGSLTLAYGFTNAVWAIAGFCLLMFLIGLPIARYAARYGVDIDLLTRGAGFGYMGSTLTSLIYASFTFILFAIEASILSVALHALTGLPLPLAHIVSSLVVIPIALYGISMISRMQLATQLIWLGLQFVPLVYIITRARTDLSAWTRYPGAQGNADGSLNLMLFGMAASTLLSLLPQIGEQVDYLRFLPGRRPGNGLSWWTALLVTGPGWVLPGGFKLLLGSFLGFFALRHGLTPDQATQPTAMYSLAFSRAFGSAQLGLLLAGVFVIVCQLKINVTNAYAGSIAWSNFFSRLTHSHPGRVVWLVFNVVLALLLMETDIVHVIEGILRIYANFAAGWIGALTADLVINKPLGLSPPYIEFKRAHLYDINPVGVGALLLSIAGSTASLLGAFGGTAQILSPFVGLGVAFAAAPVIAWATGGRYYLARRPEAPPEDHAEVRCCICENLFERRDVAMCPAYSGPICSLCCTLEARCHDVCKENSRFGQQLALALRWLLPTRWAAALNTRGGQFLGILTLFALAIGLLLSLIYHQYAWSAAAAQRGVVRTTLWLVFLALLVLSGVAAWLIVLAHESRRAAEQESMRQTTMLMEEIEAHQRTDAALQRAKEVAEAANVAKTRYLVGISHEIRTPLNSISGYAQLLERSGGAPMGNAVRVIRRSAEHLANLVDGLLDISRIENGMLRLNRDKVRLIEFLDQIVDMFRLQAAAKGIAFHYQRPPHLPALVHTDGKRLRQILINLLSNAIKYTEHGHASLVVRYRSQVAEFEVSDTGIGIPHEDLTRIFEPFERGHDPAVRALPGTGLGLTITKLLTQIMGGELSVRSTPGTGSQLTCRLLLSEAVEDAAQARPRPVSGYQGARRTVLIADDDPAHLDLVCALLRPLGFTVLPAPSGGACLALAAQYTPDLALLDISMPDMTGWEVARALRTARGAQPRGAGPGLKIVIVSANAHEYRPGGDGESAHDAFMMKPIELDALLAQIGELLALAWVHEVPAQLPPEQPPPRVPSEALQHVDDLYRLGSIGHVRGIEARLREIEAQDEASRAFAAHLRSLVSNFDLKRYMGVLEELRRKE
ncbi:MAG TPA: ATP-binding protein [Steroidobacteraceae bacterium]|nr:ATP-binding protein [Steroidobacteraceae bacterium]